MGSVLVLVGSLGVGWLGPASALRGWLLFELLRSSRGAVAICGLFVVLGALLLFAAWLSLGLALWNSRDATDASSHLDRPGRPGRPAGPSRLRQVVVSAAAWSAPLLLTVPMFSRDMFAYVGQGRLMAAGLDPYTTGVADLPGWFGLGVDPLWADTQTPYGPVFVTLERLVVSSTDAFPPEVAVFGFRLLAFAGLAMLAYYAWRIARLRGLDAPVVLWAVAASPLVLINFVVAGHNDALMLGCIAAGVYYALRDRPVLGTVFVALAIGIKPIALIALPVIGLIWAGSTAGWAAVIRRWAAVAAIALGGLAALGWGLGVGVGWIGALATPVTISSWYAPANILGISIGGLANAMGLPGDTAQTGLKLALLALGCAAAAYLLIAKRRADPLWLLAACFAVIVLSSPVVHPWYGLWLLTLLALASGVRMPRRESPAAGPRSSPSWQPARQWEPWRLRTLVYSTGFFLLIGLAEPLDLVPRLETDAGIPVLVIGTALVGVTALLIVAERAARRSGVFPLRRSGRLAPPAPSVRRSDDVEAAPLD